MNSPPREAGGVIDAHVHLRGGKHVAAQVMRRAGLRHFVNINYMSAGDAAQTLAFGEDLDQDTGAYGDAFLACTTFPLADFGAPDFAERAIAFLAERFACHPNTIAVKLWKNVGLELRDTSGQLVHCDDERFSPVFAWLERRRIPVYLHIGDPIAAWQPLDPASPHHRYYSRNPQYHFFGKVDAPSFAELIAAQDRLIARWPGIRFIAAHLASLAHDVGLVARFLEAHPNAAVDSSARHSDLRGQPAERVRALFMEFPGRILFGSDWSARFDQADRAADEAAIAQQCGRLEWDFAYFEQELALPATVLRGFYHGNACDWLGLSEPLDGAIKA